MWNVEFRLVPSSIPHFSFHISHLSCPYIGSRLSTRLREQTDVAETHPAINRFAHIVDCERRHRGRRHRFHLHPGRPSRLGCGSDSNRTAAFAIRLRVFFK